MLGDRLPKLLDGEGEPMHCGRHTLEFPGFLGILAHAQTVCTRLSFRERKEPGVEANRIVDRDIDQFAESTKVADRNAKRFICRSICKRVNFRTIHSTRFAD